MGTITEQEVFDRVAIHLFTQGQAAYCKVNQQCMYRGPNGLKCAVGCLIPDDKYDAAFEGNAICYIYEEALPVEYHKHLDLLDLLTDLQCVHDRSASWTSPAGLFHELKYLAALRSLSTAAIDKYRSQAMWPAKHE